MKATTYTGNIRRTVPVNIDLHLGKITAEQNILNFLACACSLAATYSNQVGCNASAKSYSQMAAAIGDILEKNHYFD